MKLKYILKTDKTTHVAALALSAALLAGCSASNAVSKPAVAVPSEIASISLPATESTAIPAPNLQPGHTPIAADSAALMLPVAEGLIRSYEEQGLSYDTQNSVGIWWTLYYIAEISDRTRSQSEITVTEEQLSTYLTAAFSELSVLPDIPEELTALVTYDPGERTYHFIHPDEPIGEARISKAEVLLGSLYEFTVHFSYPDGSTSDYTLTANDYPASDGQTAAPFPYAFTNMRPTEYPCTDNC